MTETVNGSLTKPPPSGAEFGLEDPASSAIVPCRTWAPDPDLNSIAIAFVLVTLLQRAGSAAVQLGESECVPQWIDNFRQVLAECLNDRALLLRVAARRMAVSPRTLQRLLEREGTTWRAEVEALRRLQVTRLQRVGFSKSQIAHRLGYSDVRALRRALRHWESEDGQPNSARCATRLGLAPKDQPGLPGTARARHCRSLSADGLGFPPSQRSPGRPGIRVCHLAGQSHHISRASPTESWATSMLSRHEPSARRPA